MSRFRLAIIALLAGLASAAPASADVLPPLSCPEQELSQPFLRFADPLTYRMAAGGSFEAGTGEWALSGAQIVAGNEPYHLNDPADEQSLALGSGDSALSPENCVSVLAPTLRFMVRSTGSILGVLTVSAAVDGDTVPLGVVTGLSSSWRPSLPMVLTTALLPTIGSDATTVRFRFKVSGPGGAFQVDDVYVDPYGRG